MRTRDVVGQVMDHVVVRFQDGSMCRVSHATPDRLIPSSPGSLFPDEEQCPYYPGLVVRAGAQRGAAAHGSASKLGQRLECELLKRVLFSSRGSRRPTLCHAT